MLFGHQLTEDAAQIFADVRAYWSPEAVERASPANAQRLWRNGIIHLINSVLPMDGATVNSATAKAKPT